MVSQAVTTPTAKALSTYVPFGGRVVIGHEAARPRPEFVTLSWGCGLKAQRPSVRDGKVQIDELSGEVLMENILYAGFFCNIGDDTELDAALEAVETPKVTIAHPETGPVEHWALQRCALYLLAEGLQSRGAMRTTTERMGVAYGWRANKKGGVESYLYCHVLPRQILGSYSRPLVLAVKGTQTEDVLKLFYKQFDVLAFAHEVLRAQNTDMELPLWSYAMPAGPAKKTEARGNGKVSDIFPVKSLTPDALTVEYLAKYEAPIEHLDTLYTLAVQSVAWSSELVARIATEQEAGGLEEAASH